MKNNKKQLIIKQTLLKERDKAQKYLDMAEVLFVEINKKGQVSYINRKGCDILGYKYKKIVSKNWFDNFIPERTKDYAKEFQKELLAGKIKHGGYYENPVLTKTGEEKIIIWRHTLLKDDAGNITGHIKSGADITELKGAEESLHKVNRALMVVTKCNQAMVRAKEEQELLNEICKIIVYAGGYRFAWVGYPDNDDNKTVRLASYAGEETDFLKKINITWADTKLGRGPTGTAIRTGKPSKCNDTLIDPNYSAWRPYAAKLRYNSSIAIPLILNGKVFGALTICAIKQNAFDVREIKLLTDLTNDLAFGIMALRARAKQKESEEELKKYQKKLEKLVETRTKKLEESEEKYKSVVENLGIGVALISPNMEILTLNKQMRKWFPDIDISKKPICYKSFNNPPREEICTYCPTNKTLTDGQVHESITETPMGDKIINYRIISSPVKDKDGKVTAAIEMVEDVTERKNLEESKKEQSQS